MSESERRDARFKALLACHWLIEAFKYNGKPRAYPNRIDLDKAHAFAVEALKLARAEKEMR